MQTSPGVPEPIVLAPDFLERPADVGAADPSHPDHPWTAPACPKLDPRLTGPGNDMDVRRLVIVQIDDKP
jgi:hypothetical protein